MTEKLAHVRAPGILLFATTVLAACGSGGDSASSTTPIASRVVSDASGQASVQPSGRAFTQPGTPMSTSTALQADTSRVEGPADTAAGPEQTAVAPAIVLKALTQSTRHLMTPVGVVAQDAALYLTWIATGDAADQATDVPDDGAARIRFSMRTGRYYAPTSFSSGVRAFASSYPYTADASTLTVATTGELRYGMFRYGYAGPANGTGLSLAGSVALDATSAEWHATSDPSRSDQFYEELSLRSVPEHADRFSICHGIPDIPGPRPGATVCTEHDRSTGEMLAATRTTRSTQPDEPVGQWRWDADAHLQFMQFEDSRGVKFVGPDPVQHEYKRVARWDEASMSVDWIIVQTKLGLDRATSLTPVASDSRSDQGVRTVTRGTGPNQRGEVRVTIVNDALQSVDETRADGSRLSCRSESAA